MATCEQVSAIEDGLTFLEGAFKPCSLCIDGQRIASSNENPKHGITLNARGCYVVPGLVDIHFHGAVGHDLSDGNLSGIHAIGAYEAKQGITAMCPATMTLPESQLQAAMEAAAHYEPTSNEASLVGINLEGPFISSEKIGAQNPSYVRNPRIDEFLRLQKTAGGLIKLVDIAPEEPGADDFIYKLSNEVRISVAHTCATYEQARHAFELGARHVTHLFNAMNPLHHREPGPIAAAAENGEVVAEIIADGIHIHPAMVRLAFSLFGKDRIVFVSDSLRAAGLSDGTYDLGGQTVQVHGNEARIDNGSLAGSVSNLFQCVRKAVLEMNIPLEWAIQAATINPARAIGVDDSYGSLECGKSADVLLIDKETLELKSVVVRGMCISCCSRV